MSLGRFKKRRTEQPTEYVPISADRAHEIIEDFCSDVVQAMDVRPPEHIVNALTVGILLITQRKLSKEAMLEGQVVARLGYCTRSVEFGRLYAAREMDIDLAKALQAYMVLQDDDEPAISGVTEFASTWFLASRSAQPSTGRFAMDRAGPWSPDPPRHGRATHESGRPTARLGAFSARRRG